MEASAHHELEQCKVEVKTGQTYREEITAIVREMVQSCYSPDCFAHVSPEPIPSREVVIAIIQRVFCLLYPGYFNRRPVDAVNLTFYLGQEAIALFEELSRQVTLSFRHECLRYGLPCIHCQEKGQEEAVRFLRALPALRAILATDVKAAYEGDPAAKSFDEVIFSYPGLFAVTVYRAAHQLLRQGVPLMPRIMTEYAHSRTGIDIHPGAEIGKSFFIDHGTGVVIGETTDIGHRVRLYQGVTLGALSLPPDQVESLRSQKRHPTVEDDVIIYSGATILGGDTVIGARAVIGGNVWLTESVPSDTKVFLKKPELIYKPDLSRQRSATAGER
jgi:serine O-acetyltransferase